MNLKQIQEAIKDAPDIKVLDESQYIQNGCSIFNSSSNPHWIGGACDPLILNDGQLILVESIKSISSRECKVKFNWWNPFLQFASDTIKICQTSRIFIITSTKDINKFLTNFNDLGDFYKSLENVNYTKHNYEEDPEYFSNYEDYLRHEDEDFFNDDDDSSVSGDPYEDFCDSQQYENEIDYSGENPLSPFEYRFIEDWVEVGIEKKRVENEDISIKKIKGSMTIGGTLYLDEFVHKNKISDSLYISDIIVGNKTMSASSFTKLIKSISY